MLGSYAEVITKCPLYTQFVRDTKDTVVLVHELEPLVARKAARIKSVRNCLFSLFKQKMNCFDE